MIRAMYSGISGMKVNQTKLDVTGNNVANVSTTGFKYSRVRFQDMLSQNVSEATGPSRNTGGVNAKQVGLGVQVSGIDTIISQGMMQPTSRNLDVAMDGTGYFIVGRGALPESNGEGISVDESNHTMSGGNIEVSYTRDGALALDDAGNLLTSDGYRVMGYALSEKDGNGNPTGDLSVDYNANGAINFIDSDCKNGLKASGKLVPLRIPESVHVKAFVNAKDENGQDTTTPMNYTGTGELKDKDGKDLGIKQPTIKIDEGKKYAGKDPLKIEVKFMDAHKKGGDDIDAGHRLFVNGKEYGALTDVVQIDKSGKIKGDAGFDGGNLANEVTIENLDVTAAPEDERPNYSWSFTLQPEGNKKMRSFSIEKDGIIKGVLDDGSVTALGQIAVSSFKNPAGLKKMGKNLYINTANSGQPIVRSGIGGPKNLDNSAGYGDMLQGMLEMSNVDLAEQFTDMIVTTRAFQASGKMITTGDEILQDIINLKR